MSVAGGDLEHRSVQAREVNARLLAAIGVPPPHEPIEPLDELIAIILSQHTSDLNSARAYKALLEQFGSFDAVRRASVDEIEAAIRAGGLARIKAARIKNVLERLVQENGNLELDFLRQMPLSDARGYLTALDGVGPKTAACVLLFALGMPAVPVDTHVHRVCRRLGLIGARTNAEQAHVDLEALVPAEHAYNFHANLVRHGRLICKAIRPRCEVCPLESICPKVGVNPG